MRVLGQHVVSAAKPASGQYLVLYHRVLSTVLVIMSAMDGVDACWL